MLWQQGKLPLRANYFMCSMLVTIRRHQNLRGNSATRCCVELPKHPAMTHSPKTHWHQPCGIRHPTNSEPILHMGNSPLGCAHMPLAYIPHICVQCNPGELRFSVGMIGCTSSRKPILAKSYSWIFLPARRNKFSYKLSSLEWKYLRQGICPVWYWWPQIDDMMNKLWDLLAHNWFRGNIFLCII